MLLRRSLKFIMNQANSSKQFYVVDVKSQEGSTVSLSNVASNNKPYNLFYKDFQPTQSNTSIPIVFLHNATGSHVDVAKFAVGEHQRVISYDRIGFGKSDDVVADNPNKDAFNNGVFELLNLLDKLKLEECALLGHSDGATIALLAAIVSKSNHGLFCHIPYVIALSPHCHQDEITLPAIDDFVAKNCAAGTPFDSYMSRNHGAKKEAVIKRWRDMWAGPLYEWDVVDLIAELDVPALLVSGDKDPYFTREQYESIGKKARLGESHILPFEHLATGADLDRVNELIVEFVGKQTKAKRSEAKF